MTVEKTAQFLINAVMHNLRDIDKNQVVKFIKILKKSKRIFLVGAGRSGYVAKSFAMRLMHLGFEVFVAGETITPAIKKNDLLIAVTGSGETSSTVLISKAAKKQKARIVALTSQKNSTIAKTAELVVRIKGRRVRSKEFDYLARQLTGGHEPLAPLGTLFELTSMFFLDSIISELMILRKTKESYLKAFHTNLE